MLIKVLVNTALNKEPLKYTCTSMFYGSLQNSPPNELVIKHIGARQSGGRGCLDIRKRTPLFVFFARQSTREYCHQGSSASKSDGSQAADPSSFRAYSARRSAPKLARHTSRRKSGEFGAFGPSGFLFLRGGIPPFKGRPAHLSTRDS